MPVVFVAALQLSDGRVFVGVVAVSPVGGSGAANADGAHASAHVMIITSAANRCRKTVTVGISAWFALA